MGRKSIKADKSEYQIVREELSLTREEASELIPGMTSERIEKIENGRVHIQPDDVMLLAKGYKRPHLCNYYCSHECPIGQVYVPEVQSKELGQIAIETVNCINRLNGYMSRFFEIVEDGTVNPWEYEDFMHIKDMLEKISSSADALGLWLEQAIASGKVKTPD